LRKKETQGRMKNKTLAVIKNMLSKKSTDAFIAESKSTELKKTLNIFDLLILGVSAVVGTGIFTIIGSAIVGSADGAGAGTAVVVSMVIAAIASLFSALAYSEIAAIKEDNSN
jgi:APA family basic amino acid/polyamine antiporter